MKILHVIPSISERSGGPGQAIVPMCRSLRAAGMDVLLATTDADLDFALPLRMETVTTYKEVPVIFFKKQWGDSFKYSRSFSRWLYGNVSHFDLVHIHAVFNHPCIVAARACRQKGVPYIVRPLGTLDPWSMKQKSLRKMAFWHAGIKKMLSEAAAIHYTSTAEQQSVEESRNLDHGVVIPLGVEIDQGQEAQPSDHLGLHFPSLRDCRYVLVLSRLLPTKGFDVLLKAFLCLIQLDDFAGWRLVIAGEGPVEFVALLKRIVKQHHADGNVVFTGWVDGEKKEAVLSNASLLALPSQHENFGLCVMESLARGVPVLISPHVNLAPQVEASNAGWIADINETSLKRSLASAMREGGERTRRGHNGLSLAIQFSWQNVALELKKAYYVALQERS